MTLGVPSLAAGFASRFDEIGPYIGFGSLVAVVAMAIIVFAQGRELQRLREWAGTSPERLDALEQQVQSGAVAPPPAPPVQRPGYVVPGAVPAAAATAAGAAAGAPPRPPGAPPAAPGTAVAPPPAPGTPGAPAPPGSPVVGADAAAPGAPPRPSPPRPTPPGTPGSPATRVLTAAAAGGPRAATAAGAAASSRDRDRDRGGSDRPPRSIGQIIGVSVVGVVVLLALLFAFGVIGGGDPGPDRTPPGETVAGAPAAGAERSPRYPPTEMKTLVLNASGSEGLAKDVSDSIEEKHRFPMGAAANYNSIPGGTDTSATTMIFYRAGAGEQVAQNKAAAQDVARFLELSPLSRYVKRMPDPVKNSTADQRVVVIVGADYARRNAPAGGTAPNSTSTTPGAAGGTGTTGGGTATTPGSATPGSTPGATTPGGAATEPVDPGTSQLTPNTDDLGTDPGVDDGTGGTTLP